MKILVVTNLYPPHHIGGYELGCRDVVDQLRARGHALRVLTGDFRHDQQVLAEPEVERSLQFNFRSADPAHDKWRDCGRLAAAMKRFAPDVVYFWNQAGLCPWLPLAAYWHGAQTAFFLSDTNCVFWRIGAWLLRWAAPPPAYSFSPTGGAGQDEEAESGAGGEPLPPFARGEGDKRQGFLGATVRALFGKTFLVRGWPVIRNQTCHFCSDFIRQVAVSHDIAVAPRTSVVAHWGIELSRFAVAPRVRWPVRRLLYVGQMIPQKGVHTAIAAFARVAQEPGFADLTFSLAGGGLHPDYEAKLRELPAQLGVAGRVHFLGKVSRAELPRVYAEHDVLLFPSEWDEPFAITPLEAIHCGLAVVGTTTGGSGELFRNRETAMTFRADDAADCARALRELCADRKLLETITVNAQREVRARHTLDAMVDKIEESLKELTR